MTVEEMLAKAKEIGFEQAGELNISKLEFLPEVRDMCAADRCQAYGRNWACPPAIGTIEEAGEKASKYSKGILVQSVGEMEDEFDWETMMDTEAAQKERFAELVAYIRGTETDCLPMSAGTCTVCKECTYPDAPCRFPEKSIPSMEAYGIFVSKLCTDSGMKYNYGKNTMAYTSAILFN